MPSSEGAGVQSRAHAAWAGPESFSEAQWLKQSHAPWYQGSAQGWEGFSFRSLIHPERLGTISQTLFLRNQATWLHFVTWAVIYSEDL